MNTKRFKTNAACGGCVAQIATRLDRIIPHDRWSIDLSSPHRILTVPADTPDDQVLSAVREAGYEISRLD